MPCSLNSADSRPKLDSKTYGQFMVDAPRQTRQGGSRGYAPRTPIARACAIMMIPILQDRRGLLLDDDGGMIGTMLVVEAEQKWSDASSPRSRHVCAEKMSTSVVIHPFNWGLGNPSLEGSEHWQTP